MVALESKGKLLLRVLVREIDSGRVKPDEPTSFISYSEALAALGHKKPTLFAGRRLQREGLTELNEWTKTEWRVPKIAGLIVNKASHEPSYGYWTSHGFGLDDSRWRDWWLKETAKAIKFDWTPYV